MTATWPRLYAICVLLQCFLLPLSSSAQNGWLPPVTFAGPTTLCDNTGDKLVFYDEFNGNTLDRTKWHSYNVFFGNETDNWSEGRYSPGISYNSNSLLLDENVVVSNGTCKLIENHGSHTWRGHTSDFSAGLLETYYTNSFNNGRFEARIKYPTFRYAHCDFWTWTGGDINTIDIAEAYGAPLMPWLIGRGGNNQGVDYEPHSMKPQYTAPYNSYNINADYSVMSKYPNQTWWDWFTGKYFDQSAWHTYGCAWDPNVVSFYLDNQVVSSLFKYSKSYKLQWPFSLSMFSSTTINIASGCAVSAGSTWDVTKGFPYVGRSSSNLRLNVGLSKDEGINPGDYPPGYYKIGQMEVDYVKVWQRHPEQEGHTDLCQITQPVISGPSIVCDNTITPFSINPTYPGGTWSVSDVRKLSVAGTSTNGTQSIVNVRSNNYQGFNEGIITYNAPGLPGCPPIKATKKIDVGNPKGYVGFIQARPTAYESFEVFIAPGTYMQNANSPTIYEWNIDVSDQQNCTNKRSYHFFGQTVTTPKFTHATYPPWWYCIDYTLKMTNACGTQTYNRHILVNDYTMNVKQPYNPSQNAKTAKTTDDEEPYLDEDSTFAAGLRDYSADTGTLMFIADITDTAAYEAAVANRIARTQFEIFEDLDSLGNLSANDSIAIINRIQQIRMDELGPYLLMDESESKTARHQSLSSAANHTFSRPFIYPNPGNNTISITPLNRYVEGSSLHITVMNNIGQTLIDKHLIHESNKPLSLDVSLLPPALYYLTIQNGGEKEGALFSIVR